MQAECGKKCVVNWCDISFVASKEGKGEWGKSRGECRLFGPRGLDMRIKLAFELP